MREHLLFPDEVKTLIEARKPLLLAGEESLLRSLPKGQWLGGTIAYFMDGVGVSSREKIFVQELPEGVSFGGIAFYDAHGIEKVYAGLPENGFGVVLMPAKSRTLFEFALHAPDFPEFSFRPLVGWVTGTDLDDPDAKAKVFDGEGREFTEGALVMRCLLPQDKTAEVHIVNLFTQGEGDAIEFLEDGFSARRALVNGQVVDFATYFRNLDIRLPLVADYNGAMINVCIEAVREEVSFFAPVFKGVVYKHAKPIGNYAQVFAEAMPKEPEGGSLAFACNCVLNYLYGSLEGRPTGKIAGPATFGEIAYQLLNQTLVYLTIA